MKVRMLFGKNVIGVNAIGANVTSANISNRTGIIEKLTELPVDTTIAAVIIPVIFGIILVSGIIGNGSVIAVVMKYTEMRTVPNIYIVSLAVGDLLLVVVSVPFSAFIYVFDSWYYGEFMCKFSEYIQTMSLGVSVFMLTLLTIDRYNAITTPMYVYVRSLLGKTVKSVICVWVVSIALAVPDAFMTSLVPVHINDIDIIYFCEKFPHQPRWYNKAQVVCQFVLYFVAPLVHITVCYAVIGRTLYRSSSERYVRVNQRRTRRRKSTRLVLYFVMVFVISWLPRHVFLLWHHLGDDDFNMFWYVFKVFGFCLVFLNSCMNPIVLYLNSQLFRKYFCQLFRRRVVTGSNQSSHVTDRGQPNQSSHITDAAQPTQPNHVTDPGKSNQPSHATDPELNPVSNAAQPTQPSHVTDPGQPSHVTDTAQPTQPSHVTDIAQPTQLSPVSNAAQATQPSRMTDPGQPSHVTEAGQPNQSSYTTDAAQPNQPSHTTDSEQPNQPSHVTDPRQPNQQSRVTDPAQPNQPSHVTDAGQPNQPNDATGAAQPNQPNHVPDVGQPNQPNHITDVGQPNQTSYITDPAQPNQPSHVDDARRREPAISNRCEGHVSVYVEVQTYVACVTECTGRAVIDTEI